MWLLIVLLLASPLYGAVVIPEETKSVFINDFSGGLNTTAIPHKVPLNMSPNMRNVFIDEKPGSVTQIRGFKEVGSTNTLMSGQGIFPFFEEDGVTSFIVTDSSVVLSTKDFQFYTFVSSGLNDTALLRCKQVRNKMWCTNSLDSVFTWDGTVKTILDGTLSTPNVPKGKYIEFYQERVWMLNTSGNGSSLNFSALASTAGIQVAPDTQFAWPAANQLNVGQGDGQLGTALWIDAQLQVGKERSIYTIFGTNESNYVDRKTLADIGVASNDSVVVLDGRSYFLSQDGIYENRRRISDLIIPDVEAISKEETNTIQNIWNTQSEFAAGDFTFGSTATAGGLLSISKSDDQAVPTGLVGEADPDAVLDENTTFYHDKTLDIASTEIRSDFQGVIRRVNAQIVVDNPNGCDDPITRLTIKNVRTSEVAIDTEGVGSPTAPHDYFFSQFTATDGISPLFTFDDLTVGQNLDIKVEHLSTGDSTPCDLKVGAKNLWTFFLSPATTGQFKSEVTTLTSVTAWGNFDSVNNTRGGTIDYFIRTSTSSVNITTQVWTAIVPGVRINAPLINNFVQWASTITTVSTITATDIDNVTISHVEGQGNVNRAFGISWKNRFWLSVATSPSGNFSLQYVKSRITNSNPDAWMPIQGINIRSFGKDGSDVLYGGDPSTGTFYRLDFGDDFNGSAITAFYETPELVLGSNFQKKSLFELLLDADREMGGNMKLGIATDGGSFTDTSLDLNGSGRFVRSIRNITRDSFNTFAFRFKNDTLDNTMAIHNFGIIYKPKVIRARR